MNSLPEDCPSPLTFVITADRVQNSAEANMWSGIWIRINPDPNVCQIAPKMLQVHSLVGVSHFSKIRNKNLAIANSLHVSCAHDTLRASIGLNITPWPWNLGRVSLKVTGNGIIHDLVVVELFDVEYYCDLEMWVRGHWRSLKVVLFESLGTVSCSPSVVTMAVCLAISDIFSVKEWRDLGRARWRSLKMAPFDRPYATFYSSAIVNIALSCTISSFLTLNNIVTLKSGLEVTQCHWNWCHSKAWVQFPIRLL